MAHLSVRQMTKTDPWFDWEVIVSYGRKGEKIGNNLQEYTYLCVSWLPFKALEDL